MDEIAPQIEFQSLDDFVNKQNNFYMHFRDNCFESNNIYRLRATFKRFQIQNPEMEQDVTKATIQVIKAWPEQRLPYEQLWEAYNLMSKLVFVNDEYVMRGGQPDREYLIR